MIINHFLINSNPWCLFFYYEFYFSVFVFDIMTQELHQEAGLHILKYHDIFMFYIFYSVFKVFIKFSKIERLPAVA